MGLSAFPEVAARKLHVPTELRKLIALACLEANLKDFLLLNFLFFVKSITHTQKVHKTYTQSRNGTSLVPPKEPLLEPLLPSLLRAITSHYPACHPPRAVLVSFEDFIYLFHGQR